MGMAPWKRTALVFIGFVCGSFIFESKEALRTALRAGQMRQQAVVTSISSSYGVTSASDGHSASSLTTALPHHYEAGGQAATSDEVMRARIRDRLNGVSGGGGGAGSSDVAATQEKQPPSAEPSAASATMSNAPSRSRQPHTQFEAVPEQLAPPPPPPVTVQHHQPQQQQQQLVPDSDPLPGWIAKLAARLKKKQEERAQRERGGQMPPPPAPLSIGGASAGGGAPPQSSPDRPQVVVAEAPAQQGQRVESPSAPTTPLPSHSAFGTPPPSTSSSHSPVPSSQPPSASSLPLSSPRAGGWAMFGTQYQSAQPLQACPTSDDGHKVEEEPEQQSCCVGEGAERMCWPAPRRSGSGGGRPFKMIFHSNDLTYRGVPVSMYDYAHFHEEMGCGISYISYFTDDGKTEALPKFEARFPGRIIPMARRSATSDMDAAIERHGIHAVYTQQAGEAHATLFRPTKAPLVVHAVFLATDPHGQAYAAVSDAVPRQPGGQQEVPTVPLIVRSDPLTSLARVQSLRRRLGIPPSATVFCRHGGAHTFSIEYTREAVCRFAGQPTHAQTHYFLWLGTDGNHCEEGKANIIRLTANTDLEYKRQYLRTCDACIHGREDGETFGLAVAECSVAGLPVITYAQAPKDARHHLDVLGEHAITYRNADDLVGILEAFNRTEARQNAGVYASIYARFAPARVMKQFYSHFGLLDGVLAVSTGGAQPARCSPPPDAACCS